MQRSPKCKLRISCDPYIAEVLHDPSKPPLIWHWIVQQRGNCEILYWGQESSEAEAVRYAHETLDDLTDAA